MPFIKILLKNNTHYGINIREYLFKKGRFTMDKKKLFTKILAGVLLGMMVLSVCATAIIGLINMFAK